mmetsp:Transcript_7468/g.9227  ORF Transcript_7468/g.9227 Transcript_7468/m.9227 type:complete len:98 (-) Transcript_7468:41-334(-)
MTNNRFLSLSGSATCVFECTGIGSLLLGCLLSGDPRGPPRIERCAPRKDPRPRLGPPRCPGPPRGGPPRPRIAPRLGGCFGGEEIGLVLIKRQANKK